ncbi:hypothetical protein [Pigmentiphaga sp. H8]|uniref:hypothetical protein n=1 Tax=Pigmentiphaga sp. H8 TaxID=2488560 RepID=UPI001375A2C5|nr:hypothetical protein [Pigmentiphaga sp. H8]
MSAGAAPATRWAGGLLRTWPGRLAKGLSSLTRGAGAAATVCWAAGTLAAACAARAAFRYSAALPLLPMLL